jgi:putative ABC transport system permease protein
MNPFFRDFRHGLASLWRDPGFSAVAIGVLALGIGANVAMFSLVDAVLLKPLPFPEPDRIVRVWEAPRPGVTNSTSTLDFLDWERMADTFDALAAERAISVALTGEGEPARLAGKAVTSDYFRVFGANAVLGRTFRPEEDDPGASPVLVLSHAAWQNDFGGDPEILGRRPVLDGEPHEVVGVLAPGAFDRGGAKFWKPLVFTSEQQRRSFHWLTVHGRLRRDATVEQAREQMRSIDAALEEVTPAFKREWTIVVEPLDRLLVGNGLRRSVTVAFGAVALVLLIACANVANLLLSKGVTRRKELAIRAAIGAGRGRLAAQLLTETLVLCLAGGAAGVVLASLLLSASGPVLPDFVPFTAQVSLDLRALAFAAAIAMGVALLVGALPALQTDFGKLSVALNRSSRGSSGSSAGVRRAIAIGEVALSLILLSGAALLFRSLFNLQQLETGVRVENVMTMSVNLPTRDYPTPERAALYYEAVAERLRAVPGVEQVALATHLPLRWIGNGEGLQVPGVDEIINVRFKRVDPGYFAALGIPVLSGRGISSEDRLGTPRVVVLNEAAAARLAEVAGMANPVGRRGRISIPDYLANGGQNQDVDIVGIIRSERVSAPGNSDPAVAYVSMAQAPRLDFKIFAGTYTDPEAVMPAIRDALREIDPNLPLGDLETMQQVREGTLSGATRPAWVIGTFAAVAALLAALGLYGVLAHAVSQQRREFGIRMALGARSQDVLAQVLRRGLTTVAAGIALGLLGTFAATRVIESMLFEVSPLDPPAVGLACAAMAAVGLLAGLVPARRAAAVAPATVLREE